MLIDRQIRAALASGDLSVDPLDGIDNRIQPASLDLRLASSFLVWQRHAGACIDPKLDSARYLKRYRVGGDSDNSDGYGDGYGDDGYFVIHPGDFVLAATLERIGLSGRLAARVEGKSSIGRLGLLVHSTAGFIDPGWPCAAITLELANVNLMPIKLWPGMPIAQLAFDEVDKVAAGYSGKYVSQQAPTPSRFHLNWTGSAWI